MVRDSDFVAFKGGQVVLKQLEKNEYSISVIPWFVLDSAPFPSDSVEIKDLFFPEVFNCPPEFFGVPNLSSSE